MASETVVIGLNWVGDNVLALPTYRALHHRYRNEGGIAIAAPENVASLLGAANVCRKVIPWNGRTRDRIAALRRGKFRRAIILPNSFRAAAVAYAAGISERWGYNTDCRSFLLTNAVARVRDRGHQLDDYMNLLAAMNVPHVVDELPSISLPVAVRERAKRRLKARGLRLDRALIGIHAGGLYGRAKHWGDARYCETAERLRTDGHEVVLLTSPGERAQAQAIATACNGIPIFGESGDVLEVAAAISQCSLVITNDSGPLHLAAALAVPTVSIFGPTDPNRTVIAGASHVVRAALPCAPCYARECPLGHHRCMNDISVDDVYTAALRMLGADEPVVVKPEPVETPAVVHHIVR